MKKKILITGASGFVGGFLVEEAIHRGLDVYAAIRKTSDTTYLDPLNATLVYIDFENKEQLREIFTATNYDYVIHNAGLTKSKSKEGYFKVNKDYLRYLIEAIRSSDTQLDKFLFVSSLAAYGPADFQKDGIVTNESTPHPVTNYGRSKLAAEQYLNVVEDIPWCVIRPTVVYGPREYDLLTVFQTLAKGLELYVGFQSQVLTFVQVRDLVTAMMDVTLSDIEYKSYFITDGKTYSAQNMNKYILNQLNKNWAIPIKLPVSIVRGIGYISEKIAAISGKYPALNVEKVNELESRSWNCDICALKQDIQYSAKHDFESGIVETITWYKENKLL